MATTWTKLTKKQKRHLRAIGIRSLAAFKANHAAQEKMRADNDHNPVLEPCWECRDIATALGLFEKGESDHGNG